MQDPSRAHFLLLGVPAMKIALIAPPIERVPPRLYGGTERVIYHLAQGLAQRGIQVTVFASGDSNIPGCRLIPTVPEAFRLSPKTIFDPQVYSIAMLSRVADLAHEFDLIHNHHDYWMLPLSKMSATPVITTLHGRLDLPDIASALFAFPDVRFISISDAQRGPMSLLPWIRTVHNGIPHETFRFYPQPGKYLAFIGRIDAEKRPEWAIRIASRAGVPLKIAAKIDGRRGSEYFDAFVRPHIDGHNVEYVGEIGENDKNRFLGEALALVFPIDWPEPFGLAVIESLACGTPVLARPRGAIPEITKDGVTGFIHSDPDILAERVHDLAGLSREACRDWVHQRYSVSRMTEDYIDVYREVISSRRQAAGDRRHFLHSV